MNDELKIKYEFVKSIVIDEGFHDEIIWQSELVFDNIDESKFLREIAWVILTCGMKESIIRRRFEDLSYCFYDWVSAQRIVKNKQECASKALKIFNNPAKISAIVNAATIIEKKGFSKLKQNIQQHQIQGLQQFDFIGPVTAFHLAKNIGLPVAKPDRHLIRIAEHENYSDVQKFCSDIAMMSGDPISVVDIVFWRFATIESDYLNVLSSLNCSQELDQNKKGHSIFDPYFFNAMLH